MAFRIKTEDFKENYDGFLEKLHDNCLNRLLYPNYSTLFEILIEFSGEHGINADVDERIIMQWAQIYATRG
jgi:hypothetical protein